MSVNRIKEISYHAEQFIVGSLHSINEMKRSEVNVLKSYFQSIVFSRVPFED